MEFRVRTGENRSQMRVTTRYFVVMRTPDGTYKPLKNIPMLDKVMEQSSYKEERNGSRTIYSTYITQQDVILRFNIITTVRGRLNSNENVYISVNKKAPINKIYHNSELIFEGTGSITNKSSNQFTEEIIADTVDKNTDKKLIFKR